MLTRHLMVGMSVCALIALIPLFRNEMKEMMNNLSNQKKINARSHIYGKHHAETKSEEDYSKIRKERVSKYLKNVNKIIEE